MNSLLGTDVMDKERLKKAMYRNDLLSQMDHNNMRRSDRYHSNRLETEMEEERIRRDRGLVDWREREGLTGGSRNGGGMWDYNDRKDRTLANWERQNRFNKEHLHRQD